MKKTINFKLILYLLINNCISSDEPVNNSIINSMSYKQEGSSHIVNNLDDILPFDNIVALSAKCKNRPPSSIQYEYKESCASKKTNNVQSKQQLNREESGDKREYKFNNKMQQKPEYKNKFIPKQQKTYSTIEQIGAPLHNDARFKRTLKNKFSINPNKCIYMEDRDALLKHRKEKTLTKTPFFFALKSLFRSVFYYRLNIGNFFEIFHNKIQDEHNKNVSFWSKEALIEEFIELSIQFAKDIKDKGKCELSRMTNKTIKEPQNNETAYINNLKSSNKKYTLSNIIECRKICDFNHMFFASTYGISSAVEFSSLNNFLTNVFERTLLVSKYYYMLSYLLGHLYDISVIINENLKQLDNRVFDKTIFEVYDCSCSEQTKKQFVFHWAFCWISYFSKNYSLPKPFDVKAKTLALINQYPKEFFIQFIVLVHYNINIEKNYTETKYLDKQALLILKQTITDLLFKNLKDKNKSLFQLIIYNLYRDIQEINHPEIPRKFFIFTTRMQQTHKKQLHMANKLIPAIKKLNKLIFDLTKESYRLAKLKIDLA